MGTKFQFHPRLLCNILFIHNILYYALNVFFFFNIVEYMVTSRRKERKERKEGKIDTVRVIWSLQSLHHTWIHARNSPALGSMPVIVTLKFFLILSLYLCFVSKVQQEMAS